MQQRPRPYYAIYFFVPLITKPSAANPFVGLHCLTKDNLTDEHMFYDSGPAPYPQATIDEYLSNKQVQKLEKPIMLDDNSALWIDKENFVYLGSFEQGVPKMKLITACHTVPIKEGGTSPAFLYVTHVFADKKPTAGKFARLQYLTKHTLEQERYSMNVGNADCSQTQIDKWVKNQIAQPLEKPITITPATDLFTDHEGKIYRGPVVEDVAKMELVE